MKYECSFCRATFWFETTYKVHLLQHPRHVRPVSLQPPSATDDMPDLALIALAASLGSSDSGSSSSSYTGGGGDFSGGGASGSWDSGSSSSSSADFSNVDSGSSSSDCGSSW